MKILHDAEGGSRWHWCPGCKAMHPLPKSWTYTGEDADLTATPSFLQHPNHLHGRCHYFVVGGQIKFCEDSDHALAGQTVPFPEIPPNCWDAEGKNR